MASGTARRHSGTRDALPGPMRLARTCAAAMIAISTLAIGCATTTTYSAESTDEYSPREGTVESVRQIVHRVEGNPGGGAAAGAATGAALSQGSYETRDDEVTVRFDNGARGVFTYRNGSPFAPGDRIALGPDGPRRVVY